MCQCLAIVLSSLLTAAVCDAATLHTAARVTILPATDARLETLDEAGATSWSVTGAPGEHLQISLELRGTDGTRIAAAPSSLILDAEGSALAALVAPADDLGALPVMTLVICRE